MNRRMPLAVAALLVLLAVFWLWPRGPGGDGLQGYIEGDLVLVGAESAGRITELSVDSGNRVEAGAHLFALDAEEQTAARNKAAAELEDLKSAGQRPEQIAVLEAAERRAAAALELSRTDLDRQRELFKRGVSAEARLQQAQSTFERDEAALQEARRQIKAAELAGRSAMITALEAALDGAEKALAKRRVSAPVAAVIEDVYFRAGEVVAAGQPVLALLPPGNRKVRFYVPEPRLSGLRVGQDITVSCDGCEEMQAKLTFIASEAEFTPPVIFSQEERSKLVFRAEARLTKGEALPLGLPVDVHFEAAP
ncbi:secretion protein HlyD [Terrihabitans soli]|uniref:Secretion protein HlyD n=1 Tax=Terrihabitans soli TaxID=708113 RepID=A0A6S6QXM6_9HYPH|nr:HlyD family efflux transporter periplasmic adaptor subunit [Terrihabitans soli]BCJ91318.1 secretion protein HlyD [Terrihabitans soli]